MWIPNGETILLATFIVLGALSVPGFVVLARQARREARAEAQR